MHKMIKNECYNLLQYQKVQYQKVQSQKVQPQHFTVEA